MEMILRSRSFAQRL